MSVLRLVERLKKAMDLYDEEQEFFETQQEDEMYKRKIIQSFNDFVEYVEFVDSNNSVYFSLCNPNMDFKAEDYFTLYSPSEGKSVKNAIYDWEIDEELMILGCIGQETYLFSYGKEIYAFPQHLEYELENLIYISKSLEELLINKDAFNQAMKYSDLLQRYFDNDEEYEKFLR